MFPDLSKLSTENLFGRFYLKFPDNKKFKNYYQSIDIMRPFLYSEEWLNTVTGYYINTAGNFDAVRLSYFTSEPERVLRAISRLKQRTGIVESQQVEAVRKANKLPVVIIGPEKGIYSFAQAIAIAISIASENGTRGWFIQLEPIQRLTKEIEAQHNQYKRTLESLRAA